MGRKAKEAEHKRTVKFSFTMTPKEAKPILRELENEYNRSGWMRDAVNEHAARHYRARKVARETGIVKEAM